MYHDTLDDNTAEGLDMDTEDGQKNLKGNTSLVKRFSGSCSLHSLVSLVPESYPCELLSTRLSGAEIKEALLITTSARETTLRQHPQNGYLWTSSQAQLRLVLKG